MPKKLITFAEVKAAVIAETKKLHAKEMALLSKAKNVAALCGGPPLSLKTEKLIDKFENQEDSK